MTPQQVQQMIRQEIAKHNQAARFKMNIIPQHRHTGKGTDAPRINQGDIIPSQRVSGNITMGQQTTYTIGTIFNPSSIWFYGLATDLTDGIRAHVVGNAQLGPSFYLQPGTSTSVVTGGTPQNIIQSSSYLAVQGMAAHALAGEEHIIDVTWPDAATLVARATVISFGGNSVKINVDNLAANWSIQGNFVIT